MESEQQALVREVVGRYLEAEAPEEREDLEDAFDLVYERVQEKIVETEARGESGDRRARGLPFDSPFADPTLLVTSTWIVSQIVLFIRQEWRNRRILDVLEGILRQQVGDSPKARRVRALIALLEEMGGELERLRSHPDHLLAVYQEAGPPLALSYRLWPREGAPEDFGPVEIKKDPFTYFHTLFEAIKNLPAGEAGRRMAEERLGGIGAELGDRLLPRPLRRRLLEILAAAPAGEGAPTLYLQSNEAWFPWELLRLQHPDHPADLHGPFLAAAFALARRLPEADHAMGLPLRRIALVVPAGSGLLEAHSEAGIVRGLETEGRAVEGVAARYEEVVEALASGLFDGWHFSGHGAVEGKSPDRWGLRLEDGHDFSPPDLRGRARGLRAGRPLVFLNACHSARGAAALTGIGGLAQAFLEAGAGAFLGAHWAVADQPALAFATAFYNYFLKGHLPLAEAVRRARLFVRDTFPGDPTWLAYTLFGHPLASAVLSEPGEEPSSPAFVA